jgi:iron complex outermembrane receptor protein
MQVRKAGRARRILMATAAGVAALATTGTSLAQITEITVTTRKREENLQQVPIAVSAITADEMERKGINDLDAVIQQSASLILDRGFSPGDQRVVIRGLSPTRGRQNVAILVDDIDISSEAISTAGGSLLINPRLFDLERVEVVKGPQNALYGRAAFNGAVNYITRKPGDTLDIRVGTDIGSRGQTEFSGGISGPLADNLRGGINGTIWNHDGFYSNSITGEDVGGQDGASMSGTLVWDITGNLSATTRVEYIDDSYEASPYTVMPFNAVFEVPAAAGGGTVNGIRGKTPDADDLEVRVSEDPRTCDPLSTEPTRGRCKDYAGTEREITRATLTLDWDLGPVALKSLTHRAWAETSQHEGAFGTSAATSSAVGESIFFDEVDLFSQELRLVSRHGGPVSWAVGALYWDERSNSLDGSHTCFSYVGFPNLEPCAPYLAAIANVPEVVPGMVPLNADHRFRDTEHKSVYALIEWNFLENWELAFEGRQTWEDLRVGGPNVDNGLWDPSGFVCTFFMAPLCPQIGPGTDDMGVTEVAGVTTAKLDDDFFAPKVTLTWTPSDDVLTYFSWARAYKPKGFSTLNSGVGAFDPEAAAFDQEKLDVWELGGKTTWLDNRLQVNGAVFFQDFKNKQVSTQVIDDSGLVPVLVGRTVNAGAAEIWGVELDVSWQVTDLLSTYLSATWLDAEYTEFLELTSNAVRAGYLGQCIVPADPDIDGCYINYDGKKLEDVPEWSVVGGARLQAGLVGDTDWFLEGDFQYQDKRYEDDDNLLVFPSYVLFNFRAGIVNDTWDIIAYVDNAFDDDTIKTGFANGSTANFQFTGLFENEGILLMPDRRQYGLRVNYRFGAR